MSNNEAAYTRALAKGDQTAARLRGYMGRGAFPFRLDRDQLEALVNRGASQEEIQAWFEQQGRRAVAEQAILDELEAELDGSHAFGWRKRIGLGRFLSLNLSKRGASLTGRVGPLSSSTRSRKLRLRLPFGLYWRQR